VNCIDTDNMVSKVTQEVEANRMHWGSILDTLGERVCRIREQIEPLSGYAPVYKQSVLEIELEDRLNQIEAVKIRYRGY